MIVLLFDTMQAVRQVLRDALELLRRSVVCSIARASASQGAARHSFGIFYSSIFYKKGGTWPWGPFAREIARVLRCTWAITTQEAAPPERALTELTPTGSLFILKVISIQNLSPFTSLNSAELCSI